MGVDIRIARRTALLCAVALVNILSTLLPVWPMRFHVLAHRLPVTYILTAQHMTLLVGIMMLVVAYPTAQQHRHAAQTFMACAALAVVANIVKGLDVEEAIVNLVALGLLWRGRKDLQDIRLRYTVVDLARLGIGLAAITRAYNVAGEASIDGLHLLLERNKAALPHAYSFVHMLTAKLPLQMRWFDESQVLLPVFVVCVFLVFSWSSLMQARELEYGGDDMYQRFGRASHNTLAYLARRSDVLTYMDPAHRGAITYRQVGRVALQVGAILAPPNDRLAVYQSFSAYCRAHRLIPAAVALSQDERRIARRCGMRTVTIGTEAMVDLADFAVERLGKKMRWVQRSLTKRGFRCDVISAAEIPATLRVALDRIDDEWRVARGGQTHGCCMTLGRFPTHSDPECLVAVAYDSGATPLAYLTLLPGGEGVYSLDLTRRSQHAPNAIMELLVIAVLTQLKSRGASSISLNFSTFSSLAASHSGNLARALASRWFQMGTLEAFNAKFRPSWAPRYAAFPSLFALPDVVYAILSVEGVNRMVINACARGVRHAAHSARTSEQPAGATVRGENAFQ